MIKDALEGVANGTYDIIAVRPSNLDDPGISYFIERGKGKNLHIRLYITTEDDINLGEIRKNSSPSAYRAQASEYRRRQFLPS